MAMKSALERTIEDEFPVALEAAVSLARARGWSAAQVPRNANYILGLPEVKNLVDRLAESKARGMALQGDYAWLVVNHFLKADANSELRENVEVAMVVDDGLHHETAARAFMETRKGRPLPKSEWKLSDLVYSDWHDAKLVDGEFIGSKGAKAKPIPIGRVYTVIPKNKNNSSDIEYLVAKAVAEKFYGSGTPSKTQVSKILSDLGVLLGTEREGLTVYELLEKTRFYRVNVEDMIDMASYADLSGLSILKDVFITNGKRTRKNGRNNKNGNTATRNDIIDTIKEVSARYIKAPSVVVVQRYAPKESFADKFLISKYRGLINEHIDEINAALARQGLPKARQDVRNTNDMFGFKVLFHYPTATYDSTDRPPADAEERAHDRIYKFFTSLTGIDLGEYRHDDEQHAYRNPDGSAFQPRFNDKNLWVDIGNPGELKDYIIDPNRKDNGYRALHFYGLSNRHGKGFEEWLDAQLKTNFMDTHAELALPHDNLVMERRIILRTLERSRAPEGLSLVDPLEIALTRFLLKQGYPAAATRL